MNEWIVLFSARDASIYRPNRVAGMSWKHAIFHDDEDDEDDDEEDA